MALALRRPCDTAAFVLRNRFAAHGARFTDAGRVGQAGGACFSEARPGSGSGGLAEGDVSASTTEERGLKAQYPSTEWQEVQCGRPSPYLNQGGTGAVTNQAGDGADYLAQASGSNFISSATESFLPSAGGWSANGASGYLSGTGQPFVPCTGANGVNN